MAFEYRTGKSLPEKMLKGKTGRIIVTADTPGWYNSFFMKKPAINQLKKGTLQFCGVKNVKVSYIAPVKDSSEHFRNKWLSEIERLGLEGK